MGFFFLGFARRSKPSPFALILVLARAGASFVFAFCIYMKAVLNFSAAILAILGGVSTFGASPVVRFSTHLGGISSEIPTATAIGADGSIYVSGLGGGTDFPNSVSVGEGSGAFLAKLSPDGSSIAYALRFSGVFPRAIAVNGAGEVYLAGYRYYASLPVKNAIQPEAVDVWDAVVMKFNAAGTDVDFATYLGGNGDDAALGIALDGQGRVWVAGLTTSADFPVRNQSFQPNLAGYASGFLARFSNDGSQLEYATYIGGAEGGSHAVGVAVTPAGEVVVAGRSNSSQLPVVNAFQSSNRGGSDAFVVKFDSEGRIPSFFTYLGGDGHDSSIAVGVDGNGNIFVHGLTRSDNFPTQAAFQSARAGENDFFVSKLNPSGTALIYSTYLGSSLDDATRGWPNGFGSDETFLDVGGMSVSPSGRALICGTTYGGDYPLVHPLKAPNPAWSLDAVVTMIEPDGAVGFSSVFGGLGLEVGGDAAIGPDGTFVITGYNSRSQAQPEFPTTPGAIQGRRASVDLEAFVLKIGEGVPSALNDSFANAQALSGMVVSTYAQTATATKEAGEPSHNGNAGGKSIWYRWTSPVAGRAIVRTDLSSFPTLLGVYRGSTLNGLVPISEPISLQDGFREARFAAGPDEVFYIAVDGLDGASGAAILSIIVSLPANDDFSQRAEIAGPSVSVTGRNVNATSERTDWGENSVWWKWTATSTGYFTVDTTGSDFDAAVGIFRGNDIRALERQAYNDFYTNKLGRVTFAALAGTEYQIGVFGEYGESGNIQLSLKPAVRPANDDISDRVILTGRNESVSMSAFDAGFDPAELAAQQQLNLFNGGSGQILWWTWIAPIDGAADISTDGSVRLAGGDDRAGTSLLIFTGNIGPNPAPAPPAGSEVTVIPPSDAYTPASVYLPNVRAGQHYNIGVDCIGWQQPIRVSLRIRAIAPPRIVAGSSRVEGGVFKARGEGIEGHSYRVVSSTDLSAWQLVQEFPAITGEFAFEGPAGPAYRFFRIEEYSP